MNVNNKGRVIMPVEKKVIGIQQKISNIQVFHVQHQQREYKICHILTEAQYENIFTFFSKLRLYKVL